MSGKASNMPASGVLSLGEAVASGLYLLVSIADSKMSCRLEC